MSTLARTFLLSTLTAGMASPALAMPTDAEFELALERTATRQARGDGTVYLELGQGIVAQRDSRGNAVAYVSGDRISIVDAEVCEQDSRGNLSNCLEIVPPGDDGAVLYCCSGSTCDCDNSGAVLWPWTWDCMFMAIFACDGEMNPHPNQPGVEWCPSDSLGGSTCPE